MSILFHALASIGAAFLVLVLWCDFSDWKTKRAHKRERREREKRIAANQPVNPHLHGDAFWFSEDIPTMNLLHRMASGRFTAQKVRREWRRERNASTKVAVWVHSDEAKGEGSEVAPCATE